MEGRSKKRGMKCREVVNSCVVCGPTNCLLNLNILILKLCFWEASTCTLSPNLAHIFANPILFDCQENSESF